MTGKPRKTKDEFPPLLERGFHKLSVDDLKALAVDAFPKSQRRPTLWVNFLSVLARLEEAGIACDIWIDGSFLTKKIEPDDVDFVVDIPIGAFSAPDQKQRAILSELGACAFRCNLDLHSFVMFNAPVGHVDYPMAYQLHKQWENDFGVSFVKREPKGIAIVEVSP